MSTGRPAQSDRRYPVAREVVHLSPPERVALGRAARAGVPRSAHATLDPTAGRPDPVDLLESQAATRVPELVPIRYGRMLESPFAFYRGAALVMASDLAGTPSSGLRVQLCGDAHVANFGVFGSPERHLVFDINDFDETAPGPFEWDVKRLAASLEVAGRANGWGPAERKASVRAAVRAYREAMADFAGRSNLEVWYARLDMEETLERYRTILKPAVIRRTEKAIAKAKSRDSMQAFSKLAAIVDGEPRIVSDPPLVVPVRELFPEAPAGAVMNDLREILRTYRTTLQTDRRALVEQYRFVDLARKVVGVGSVGTRAWIALLMGHDQNDPLFLQVKEAQPSVLEAYAGRSVYRNAGHRVVAGQRLMQAASDIFLGWIRVTGIDDVQRDFYVRQLRDWKGSADLQGVVPEGMAVYARMCGWTLARAHARSGDRVAIASYLGASDSFDRAIQAFSSAYADLNERDHAALQAAVDSGRIAAQTGV